MKPKRGVVISNCQCQPLKHALSLQCADIDFDLYGVHLISPDTRADEVEAFVRRAKVEFDVIVSIPLSDDFGPLSINEIRSTFSDKSVCTISNIFFAGLHPDLTYIGGLAQRVEGPLGDYHSRLGLLSYLKGLSAKEAQPLFRDETYSAMGYYDVYAASLAELVHRDAGVDISIAAELPDLLKEELCFLSVNHPTSWLFAHYAGTVANHLQEQGVTRRSGWNSGPMGLLNHLASSAIFPVYPEVAAKHGLSRAGSYTYQTATIGDTPASCLDLGEFLERSFSSYDAIGRNLLSASHQGQEVLAKYPSLL